MGPERSTPTMDPALADRITKLATHVARNAAFEDMIRTKQGTNPEFSFLFGGEGADFYAQEKYRLQMQVAEEYRQQMAAAPMSGYGAAPPPPPAPLLP